MPNNNEQLTELTGNDVQILAKEILFHGFFKMVKYRFQHRLFAGGWSRPLEREMLERGDAAAVLPYDPVTDSVVLIEQIRVGALEHSQPWQLEIVAGMVEVGESAQAVVQREAQEEAGIQLHHLEKITAYYPSSGGCSERLVLFVGTVDASTAQGVHGLAEEGEDIRVRVMPRAQAYREVENGRIENGASIIALQWLELNHQRLQAQWQQAW